MTPPDTRIHVTFLDDGSGASIGETAMESEHLPESFEISTTLHLGKDDWSVVSADPGTRAEYRASGKLTLRLRRVETIDPAKVLYSLPTICEAIPPTGDEPVAGDEVTFSADDWRQLEFVSHELAGAVEGELEEVRRIHERASTGSGWRSIHVRKEPSAPLRGNLTLAGLQRALPSSGELTGITYRGASTLIQDGFSLEAECGFRLLGLAPQGSVRVLALDPHAERPPGPETIRRVRALASEANLDLVHWCRCLRVRPADQGFEDLLSGA